jgi:hypothetical protein
MRHDELEQRLRPRRAADIGRPPRQGLAGQRLRQVALAEWPVDDHAELALARQRQDALLDVAIECVVRDLHEVDRLRRHDFFDFGMPAALGRGDADVAQPPFPLHRQQQRQVLFPRQQVMHLQQIETRHAPQLARRLDLRHATRAAADPDLVGRKQPRRFDRLHGLTDHILGRSVHGRRIDQPAATGKELAHHVGRLTAALRVAADVERDPAAKADDGELFTA